MACHYLLPVGNHLGQVSLLIHEARLKYMTVTLCRTKTKFKSCLLNNNVEIREAFKIETTKKCEICHTLGFDPLSHPM